MHRSVVLCILLVALAAAPAPAAERATETSERTTGRLTISWQGDPARGCEAVGLCDVAGSVTYVATGTETVSTSSGGPGRYVSELYLETVPPVVRVLRGRPEDPAGTCVDLQPDATLKLVAESPGARRVRLRTDPFEGFDERTTPAGRCAGPLPEDLREALPSVVVDGRRLGSGAVTLDLSGRAGFAGGPFSGEIVSTLRHTRRSRRVRSPFPRRRPIEEAGRGRPGPARAFVAIEYDITAVRGGLAADFAGGADPFCAPLDACGLRGSFALTAIQGPRRAAFALLAEGPASALRGGRGAAAAIRAVREGRLRLSPTGFEAPVRGTFRFSSGREGATACAESRPGAVPDMEVQPAGDRLRLRLGAGYGVSGNELAARCPGPRAPDLGGALATGSFPRGAVGLQRIVVALAPPRVPTGAYTVTPRDSLEVVLRRRSVNVGLVRGGP